MDPKYKGFETKGGREEQTQFNIRVPVKLKRILDFIAEQEGDKSATALGIEGLLRVVEARAANFKGVLDERVVQARRDREELPVLFDEILNEIESS